MGAASIRAAQAAVAVPGSVAGRNWHPETQALPVVALELAAQERLLAAAVPPELAAVPELVAAPARPANSSVAVRVELPVPDCR